MDPITESPRAAQFILSLPSGNRAIDNITLAEGQNLSAGTVLGKISASGKYAIYDNGASDGTQAAAAVLFADTDASDADTVCAAVVRDAEVIQDELQWESGTSDNDKTAAYADLKAVGIVPRSRSADFGS